MWPLLHLSKKLAYTKKRAAFAAAYLSEDLPCGFPLISTGLMPFHHLPGTP
jgi:hypothetical protein